MSATEIINEIRRLPEQEQDEVFSFVETENRKRAAGQARHAADADFEKAADKVFRENDNLFRRLAK